METVLIYLLNASVGIVLFYSVYWLFLRKETFYVANRWYLIFALISAVFVPLFPVHYVVAMNQENEPAFRSIADTFRHIPLAAEVDLIQDGINWKQVLVIVYFTGAGIFLLRLLAQSFTLMHLMFSLRIQSFDGVRVVENEKYGLPFSFFNVVFINPRFHTQDDLPEILAHEKVHIREKHWFDLLFIELLTVIFWFNPVIWFFERSIKQNHEYLADKGVLAQGHTIGRYQALLVNQLMGMQIIGITNNLNFALNANRLKMMTKKKTSRLLGLKFVWALPALMFLLFAFAEPEYRVSEQTKNNDGVLANDAITQKSVMVKGTVYDESGDPLPGTSIVVKGGTIGTVSDVDGSFSIQIPETADLVLTFVGKKTIVVANSELTSAQKKDGAFVKNYRMEDAVQILYNPNYSGEQLIPPPPPPPAKASEESKEMAPPPPPPASKMSGEKEVFFIVEDMPKYTGGFGAMQEYINKQQQLLARSGKIKGKAKVSFTVNAKGKPSDVKIIESDNELAGKGAATIIMNMPDWTPGKQRGKSVPVKYLLPVEFK